MSLILKIRFNTRIRTYTYTYTYTLYIFRFGDRIHFSLIIKKKIMQSRGAYSRVAQSEQQENDGEQVPIRTRTVKRNKSRKELAETISNKIQAFLWVLASFLICYYTDFFRILVEDKRVNRFWFNIGLVCLGINIVIFIYISYILPCFTPKVLGKELDWNISSPRAIPIATGLGVLMSFAFMCGLWPVFGVLTPFILGINFLAFIMSMHFVPSCGGLC